MVALTDLLTDLQVHLLLHASRCDEARRAPGKLGPVTRTAGDDAHVLKAAKKGGRAHVFICCAEKGGWAQQCLEKARRSSCFMLHSETAR